MRNPAVFVGLVIAAYSLPATAQMLSKAEYVSPATYSATHQFSCTDAAGKVVDGSITHVVRKVGSAFKDSISEFNLAGKPLPKQDLARVQAALKNRIVDIVTPSCNQLGGIRIELRVWDPSSEGGGKVSAITISRDAAGKLGIR